MARKGWDNLTQNYRNRLLRQGIDKESYESGRSLHAARGHISASHEKVRAQEYRNISRFSQRYSQRYGRDADEVRDALKALGPTRANEIISEQHYLEALYESGQLDKAKTEWQVVSDSNVPSWMFFYHGIFS